VNAVPCQKAYVAQPSQSNAESSPCPGTRKKRVASAAKLAMIAASRKTSNNDFTVDRSKHSGGTAARISPTDGSSSFGMGVEVAARLCSA